MMHDEVFSSDGEGETSGRAVIGRCKSCQTDIGEFYNSFVKVTGSYALPALAGSYRVDGIRLAGKVKTAARSSELAGCDISPLLCTCGDTLGLLCVRAPKSKSNFVDRELFKLTKINFVEDSGDIVQPIFEENRAQARSPNVTANMVAGPELAEPPKEGGDMGPSETRPPLATRLPPPKQLLQREGFVEIARPSAHSDSVPYQQDGRPPSQHPLNKDLDRILPKMSHSPVNGHIDPNGHALGGAQDDLRAQLYQQQRETEKLADMVNRLSSTVGLLQDQVDTLNRRLEHQQQAGNSGAIRTFSDSLANVMDRVGQIDGIKMQVNVLKTELNELRGGAATSPATANGQFPSSIRGQSLVPQSAPQTLPHHPMVSSQGHLPHARVPSNAPPAPYYAPQRPGESTSHNHAMQIDSPAAAGPAGWTTVNQASKRSLPNGLDDQPMTGTNPTGSPKRPKLAPLDHAAFSEQPHQRPHSTESRPDSTHSQSGTPQQHPLQTSALARPGSTDAGPESALHNHPFSTSPKRGRGSGRGRPRKSHEFDNAVMVDAQFPTMAYSSQPAHGQEGSHYPYTDSRSRGSLLRRGSGGSIQPAVPPNMATSTPMPGPATGVLHPNTLMATPPASQNPNIAGMTIVSGAPDGEPYAHTRKTRTKPIRNADGVLIRKDGRPDMRSQSSAANLKKVHARKEQEKLAGSHSSPLAGQPQSAGASQHGSPTATALTHSPSVASPDDEAERELQGEKSEEERKHEAVMKQMFPRGVEQPDRAYGFGSADRSPPTMQEEVRPKETDVDPERAKEPDDPAPARKDSEESGDGMEGVESTAVAPDESPDVQAASAEA